MFANVYYNYGTEHKFEWKQSKGR